MKSVLPLYILQMARIVVGDVVELGFLVAPVEIGWPIAEAVLHLQRFVVFHVVHQVEVAHLVIVGGTNIGDRVPIALHRAPRG